MPPETLASRTTSTPPASDGAWGEVLYRPADSVLPRLSPVELLEQNGRVQPEDIQRAQTRLQEDPKQNLLDILVKMSAVSEAAALEALAEYFLLPFGPLNSEDIAPDVFELLPVEYLRDKSAVPIRRDGDEILLAVSDPRDIFQHDDFRRRLHSPVQLMVSPEETIQRVIAEMSGGPAQHVDDIIRDFDEESVEVVDKKSENAVEDLERIAGESPVIRYVNYLISTAVREGASDIHIEPGEKRLRVRCRMDGVLFEQSAPPVQMQTAVLSRLKIMAKLDIAERRLPQDGRIRATVQGRNVDLRVSTLPTVHGEKCVIRILDNRSITVGLDNLGMAAETLDEFQNQVYQPNGIILVTGPTGSGKSTTLYSALQIVDAEKLNVSTVEDPVEYELPSINQVNVHESIGMSFAAALRSLLRQDPDIIMVGEIRDPDTARIAVQASLTGHLVLSTLHTNDAPSSITRLINIGVEPYLISASVNAILAQRLVRKVCPECKTEVTDPTAREQVYLKKIGAEDTALFRGQGCSKCRETGYKGRLGLYELLVLNDEIRDVITRKPSLPELRQMARSQGMRDLRADGLQKVAEGLTTVEEIMRVTET